jgi:hypothetical protein
MRNIYDEKGSLTYLTDSIIDIKASAVGAQPLGLSRWGIGASNIILRQINEHDDSCHIIQ